MATVVPLTSRMTSPARRPARAAGESSMTSCTSTPSLTPKNSASCPLTGVTDTPRRTRLPSRGATQRLNGSPAFLLRRGAGAAKASSAVVLNDRCRSTAPLCSGVTSSCRRAPSRVTLICTARPGAVSRTRRANCCALRTRSPSNSTTTSPSAMPARAAGVSSRTPVIRAPAVSPSSTVTPMAEPGPSSVSGGSTTVRFCAWSFAETPTTTAATHAAITTP